MQNFDDYAQEMTYAGVAAQAPSTSYAPVAQHVVFDEQPTNQAAEIYSFVTLVAERCQEARTARVNEVNQPAGEPA